MGEIDLEEMERKKNNCNDIEIYIKLKKNYRIVLDFNQSFLTELRQKH